MVCDEFELEPEPHRCCIDGCLNKAVIRCERQLSKKEHDHEQVSLCRHHFEKIPKDRINWSLMLPTC